MRYEYDNLYQLTKATYPNVAPFNGEVHSWTYDGIGNRLTNRVNTTTQSYTYQRIGANPLNWQRLVNDGVNAYTYDAKGNVQTRTGFTFGWTDQSRLRSLSGGVAASYRYDYQGRRTVRTVGAATNTYVYDGLNLIRESGVTPAEYLFGPGIDEPLAMVRGGQAYYYATDGLGSVSLVTNASGAVQNSYVYDAWGVTRSQTGSLGNPFGNTARELGEAGNLFYRARQYSPAVGRFLSEDPLGFDGGINLYSYVNGNPVGKIDPLGLFGTHRANFGCVLNVAARAHARGSTQEYGWRWAHCWASCEIAKRCGGPLTARAAGAAKEAFDVVVCQGRRIGLPGADNACDSALQPDDFRDNERGATCPIDQGCEDRCGPLKGKTAPPGPLSGNL